MASFNQFNPLHEIAQLSPTYPSSQISNTSIDKETLLNGYKKIHSIFTNQQRAIRDTYVQFSDFDETKYKTGLLNSYNIIHGIHKKQQDDIKTAYEQFSDFDNAGYKQKLLNSYNIIHGIHDNHQKALNTAFYQFSDFDNAGYKQKLLGYYNAIHSTFVKQQQDIQSALKQFNERSSLPPVASQAELDKLVKTIIKTPTIKNMENVMKLLGMLKDYPESKAMSLVIVTSLAFIKNEKNNPKLSGLIQKMNERLGSSINIPPSIIENDEQKVALLNMVQHENIKQLYM
jgi:cobalamin biosynthesis Co2+ chelatase CbiK